MLFNLTVAITLLAANAFFVAAEFALVKLKSFRLDALVESGSRSAKLAQSIHQNLEPYLAACQLGITMASLGLGWIGEPTVAALLRPLLEPLDLSEKSVHTIAFIAGFITFSSLHIVVGEQVPKTFAIRKPEPVSMWVAYPLRAFYLFIFPLNWLLNAASSSILRGFGVADANHAEVLSNDEIQGVIHASEQHGSIGTEKAAMLRNVFEFDSRRVEEIMVPRGKVAYIDMRDPWDQQLETLGKIQHSRFPVIDGDDENLRGILLVKDLYRHSLTGQELQPSTLPSLLREPLVVPESQHIGVLFSALRSACQQIAVVIDEYGAFAGVVTMEDLLEEIVGEIADELDPGADEITVAKKDGHWEADGWTHLSDIERALDVKFPDEVDANTLSGLFMLRLARVPQTGDSIVEAGIRFTVESMAGRRVNLVRLKRDPDSEAAD